MTDQSQYKPNHVCALRSTVLVCAFSPQQITHSVPEQYSFVISQCELHSKAEPGIEQKPHQIIRFRMYFISHCACPNGLVQWNTGTSQLQRQPVLLMKPQICAVCLLQAAQRLAADSQLCDSLSEGHIVYSGAFLGCFLLQDYRSFD